MRARAPALRQRTLERLALWLRQCPGGADAFTATAPLWLPHLASVLADAFRSKASALVGTLCVELLCSYAVEALARDERWVALDILLATVESCAAPPLSCGRLTLQRIRRALLTRLLSSLVRSAQRFASAAPVGGAASFAPRLRKLCAAVRAHVLQPPPPPPPLRVLLHVPSGGTRVNLTVAKNVAPFNDASATARTRWDRLMAAEGAEGVAAEVALLARLCEVLDPLVVRAMMDGAADALLHAKDDDGQNLITQGLTQAGSLAGSLAGRLKGIGATAVSTVTGARTSGAGAGRGGGGGGGVAIGAEGVEVLLVGESDVSLRGGVCAASLYESLTFALLSLAQAPAAAPPPMPGAAAASTPVGRPDAPLDTLAGGDVTPRASPADASPPPPPPSTPPGPQIWVPEPSAPATPPPPPPPPNPAVWVPPSAEEAAKAAKAAAAAKAAEGGVRQRLRELLWRDLEQGCTWAHLASNAAAIANDDGHWRGRRAHVFALLVRLAAPLRDHAVSMRDERAPYEPTLADALVPLLQGVLRTYRHFLAVELAPPPPGSAAAAAAADADPFALAAGGGSRQYGQLTVVAAQLGADDLPFWLSGACAPRRFLASLSQWGPLLETPPLAAALGALRTAAAGRAAAAAELSAGWDAAARRATAAAQEEEGRNVTEAARQAAAAFRQLRYAELRRMAAADAKEAAAAAQSARRWRETLRSLQREQAAWEAAGRRAAGDDAGGAATDGGDGSVERFEHLEAEDIWRRRPLLVPNPAASDHREASEGQERSGGSKKQPSAAQKAVAVENVSSEELKKLSRHRSTAAAVTAGDDDDDDDDEPPPPPPPPPPRAPPRVRARRRRSRENRPTCESRPATRRARRRRRRRRRRRARPTTSGSSSLRRAPSCALTRRRGKRRSCSTSRASSCAAAACRRARSASRGWRSSLRPIRPPPAPPPPPSRSRRRCTRRSCGAWASSGRCSGGATCWSTARSSSSSAPPPSSSTCTRRSARAARPPRPPPRRGARAHVEGRARALLDAWHRREISNFEYLMELNTLAGRTFNDLNQYPVFPWVLADYASEKLDLGDAAAYRDLSKPVGALSPERLAQVVERYAEMDDTPELPRFHYGSHYSSAGATLFWLLRLEPFTTYAIELQSGRFDHADRLFHSVGEAWKSCNTSLADVKELIPEFFYCADFLQNGGRYDLGVRQDGERLGDVVLPPWARGSPHRFVTTMRRALESEYVSAHLHEWVDLIFGHAQRGAAAEERHNVFFYLTYEGEVDLEAVDDPAERLALETQVACFGQTPPQLFGAPHPARRAPLAFTRPLQLGPAGARRDPPVRAAAAAADGGGGDGGGRRLRAGRARARRAVRERRPRVPPPRLRRRERVGPRRQVAAAGRPARCRRWRARGATARRRCRRPTCRRRRGRRSCRAATPTGAARSCSRAASGTARCAPTPRAGARCRRTTSTRARSRASRSRRRTPSSSPARRTPPSCCGRRGSAAAPRAAARRARAAAAAAHAARPRARADGGGALVGARRRRVGRRRRRRVAPHVPQRLPPPLDLPPGVAARRPPPRLGGALPRRLRLGPRAPPSSTSTRCRARGSTPSTRRAASAARSSRPTAPSSSSAAARGHLAAWRVDDGQLACLFEPTAAGVSCATVSANELLVGTQEGEIVGYAFDPSVAYPRVDGRSVRDSAGWAQGRVQ